MSHSHRIRTAALVAAVASVAITRAASAQGQEEPSVGARVRVGLPDSVRLSPFTRTGMWIAGTLVRATPDSLVLHVGGDNSLYVERRTITGLEVSEGRSRWRSALSHAFFAGALSAEATYLVDRFEGRPQQGRHMAIAAGTGAALGAVLGVLSPFEHWRRIKR